MNKKTQSVSTDKKQYFLSEDEKNNVDSRQQLIKQYQYIIHVINADISSYMRFVVLQRLKIPEMTPYSLSADNTSLIVEDHADTSKTK